MRKFKNIIMVTLLLFMTFPVFAITTLSSGEGNLGTILDLGYIQKMVNLIIGIFAGGFLLIKLALDIFHAVRNSSEDPSAIQRAIGNFAVNVVMIGSFVFVINYVLAGMSSVEEGADMGELEAKELFFAVLSGALVP